LTITEAFPFYRTDHYKVNSFSDILASNNSEKGSENEQENSPPSADRRTAAAFHFERLCQSLAHSYQLGFIFCLHPAELLLVPRAHSGCLVTLPVH